MLIKKILNITHVKSRYFEETIHVQEKQTLLWNDWLTNWHFDWGRCAGSDDRLRSVCVYLDVSIRSTGCASRHKYPIANTLPNNRFCHGVCGCHPNGFC